MRWVRVARKRKNAEPVRHPHVGEESDNYTFRRSRTITGSAASEVVAASEGSGQLRSSRLQEHDLRAHRRKLMGYLLVSVVVVGSLGYILSQFIAGIDQVRVTSASIQPVTNKTNTYKQKAEQYLQAHPAQRFYFSINNAALEKSIVRESPEVASAYVEPLGPLGEGELVLSLRQPVVAWTIQGKKYYVDTEGVAFTSNTLTEPTISITDNSGASAAAGIVTSSKMLYFVGRLVSLVNTSGVATVDKVELPANSTREVDLRLKDLPYVVKTNSDRDPAGQAADVVSALRFVTKFQLTPQYLDVRVSSKAFYRE